MAKWHGKSLSIYVQENTASKQWRNISVDVNSVDLPSEQDIVDVAGFGDTKKNYVTGLADSKVNIKGAFDDVGTAVAPAQSGAHAVLSGLVGGTAGYGFKAGPKGSASTYPVFEGSFLLSKYNLTAAINGAVMYDADFVPFGTAGGSWTTYA